MKNANTENCEKRKLKLKTSLLAQKTSLERFEDWIDSELQALEARFAEFVTKDSVRDSLKRSR